MGRSGITVAEQCHVVNLIVPESTVATGSSEVLSMENWSHATIIVVTTGSGLTIIPKEATSFAGGGRTFLPYLYAQEGTARGDVLDAALASGTTAGVATGAVTGATIVFEIDADALSDGYPYLYITNDGQATGDGGAIAILSGGRYQEDITATATV